MFDGSIMLYLYLFYKVDVDNKRRNVNLVDLPLKYMKFFLIVLKKYMLNPFNK